MPSRPWWRDDTFATDCISRGRTSRDRDCVVNTMRTEPGSYRAKRLSAAPTAWAPT